MAGVCLFTACYAMTGMRVHGPGSVVAPATGMLKTPFNKPANGAGASGARLILVASPNERLQTATVQWKPAQHLGDIAKTCHC